MNVYQNTVVNVPKKSNNIKMIIGLCVLVCCICCVLIIFGKRSRSSTKGADIIFKDMNVETTTSTPGTESSTSASTGGDDPKPISAKPMKVQLYQTYDCSGPPVDELAMSAVPLDTEGTFDKRGKDEEHFACCMKMENAKVNATYTIGLGNEKSEHTINIKDVDKVILTEDGRVPTGVRVADWRINGRVRCAQNLHIKAHPHK